MAMSQQDLVSRWTGPTGQTDWTRVVQQGGTAPGGIPIDYDLLQREGWQRQDSSVVMQQYLRTLGLEGLSGWANQMIVSGASPELVQLQLWDQPQFKERFKGIFVFQQRFPDLVPPSPAEVLAYERDAQSLYRAAGFPPGFYDSPEDFQDLIGKGVSIKELSQRASLYQQAAFQVPQEVRNYLSETYGIDQGHLAAWAADPDRAQPLLERQFMASQSGGAAMRTGFGGLSQTEAERMADLGISAQQAQQGFGALVQGSQLFQALPGVTSEGTIGRETQLAGTFGGDALAQQEIERRRRERQVAFEGGGSFAASQQGVTGLGAPR